MSEAFADAFYYMALLNPADQFHAAAVESTKTLTERVVTTGWVLMEVADALSAPAVRHGHTNFWNESPSIRTRRSLPTLTRGSHAA